MKNIFPTSFGTCGGNLHKKLCFNLHHPLTILWESMEMHSTTKKQLQKWQLTSLFNTFYSGLIIFPLFRRTNYSILVPNVKNICTTVYKHFCFALCYIFTTLLHCLVTMCINSSVHYCNTNE